MSKTWTPKGQTVITASEDIEEREDAIIEAKGGPSVRCEQQVKPPKVVIETELSISRLSGIRPQ